MEENTAFEYKPTLTLDPVAETASAVAAAVSPDAEKKADAPSERPEIEKLSPEEQAAVREFARQIDVTDTNQVLNYGSASQKNVADFSGQALGKVRTKDLGEVGGMITNLVNELKGMDFDEENDKKGIRGFFKKNVNRISTLKTQYDKVEINVDHIVDTLEEHWRTLTKDVSMMDRMYQMNQAYQKELTMYILAGKLRIEELRSKDLPQLQEKARLSNLPEDAQAANDLANMIGRFEKKIHDLDLTRIISIQMSPQIRMIQNNDSLMAEKIQTSIVNTIPLWKSQMVIALSMYHSKQAMEAQREVTEVTNSLLKKNAESLHQGSVNIAREAERGIVDLETLKHTNEELIATLDEVRQIQDDGRTRRAEAEVELGKIEGELKQKLLETRG